MKGKLQCLLFLLLSVACGLETEHKNLVVKKDNEGNVVSEITYLNDTLMHGSAKYYYKNGNVKEEINYDSGLKNGWHIRYFENGRVKSKVPFKKGLREGTSQWYFPNGKVSEEANWLNNKPFGNSIFYYENGSVETFNCFDFQEHNRYLIKYDINKKKIREEGTVLGQLLYETNLDSIPTNTPIILKISVADPPNRDVNVVIGKLVNDELKEIRRLPVENNIVTYKETFLIKGKYTLLTIGEMKDEQGIILKRDSIRTDITVID
jgi:hypothetical protein